MHNTLFDNPSKTYKTDCKKVPKIQKTIFYTFKSWTSTFSNKIAKMFHAAILLIINRIGNKLYNLYMIKAAIEKEKEHIDEWQIDTGGNN